MTKKCTVRKVYCSCGNDTYKKSQNDESPTWICCNCLKETKRIERKRKHFSINNADEKLFYLKATKSQIEKYEMKKKYFIEPEKTRFSINDSYICVFPSHRHDRAFNIGKRGATWTL